MPELAMERKAEEIELDEQNSVNCGGDEPRMSSLNDQLWSNHLLTDLILDYLPNKDILTCSLVYKKLHSTSRDYLRRKRPCPIILSRYDDYQGELQRLLDLLETGTMDYNHPFNGIYFLFGAKPYKTRFLSKILIKDVLTLLKIIFNIVPMQHVVVNFTQEFGCPSTSTIQSFLKVIFLLLPVKEIETLRISGILIHDWISEILDFMGDGGFSSLKTLRTDYRGRNYFNTVGLEDCEAILRTCPLLTELPASASITAINAFVKYRKVFLVKMLHIRDRFWLEEYFLSEVEKAGLALRAVDIHEIYKCGPEFFEYISRILQSSRESLQKFTFSGGYHDIFKLNLLPFTNVETVKVSFPVSGPRSTNEDTDENMLNHPKLHEIFPNAEIKLIHIHC